MGEAQGRVEVRPNPVLATVVHCLIVVQSPGAQPGRMWGLMC